MAYLFRLSRIGNALPVQHLYPALNDAGDGVVNIRRDGAQCFGDLAELVQHIGQSAMVPGADRVLMIDVGYDVADFPHDESGWSIISAADVVAVRSLPADADVLYSYESDEDMWAAAEPVEIDYIETV